MCQFIHVSGGLGSLLKSRESVRIWLCRCPFGVEERERLHETSGSGFPSAKTTLVEGAREDIVDAGIPDLKLKEKEAILVFQSILGIGVEIGPIEFVAETYAIESTKGGAFHSARIQEGTSSTRNPPLPRFQRRPSPLFPVWVMV